MPNNSAFGQETYSFGPGYLYWDTAPGGENILLGDTDSIVITKEVKKVELKASQKGDVAADKAVSGQIVTITAGLAQATIDRMEQVIQGFKAERDNLGATIQIHGVSVLGQRDSSIAKRLTFKEIIDGVEADESTQFLHIIDFFKTAPSSESTALTYDATTQRYYGVAFMAYQDETRQYQGANKFWSSRRDPLAPPESGS
jgi:hypothetical protein